MLLVWSSWLQWSGTLAVVAMSSRTVLCWLWSLIMGGHNSCVTSWMTVSQCWVVRPLQAKCCSVRPHIAGDSHVCHMCPMEPHWFPPGIWWHTEIPRREGAVLCPVLLHIWTGIIDMHVHVCIWHVSACVCRSCTLCESLDVTCVQCRGRGQG